MKISLVPFCGLGNRLNVLSSAIALHQKTGHEIVAYWEKSEDCNAAFHDLFQPIPEVDVKPLNSFWLKRRGYAYLGLPMLGRKFIFDHCYKARKIWNDDFLLKTPKTNTSKIYIEGNKRFCPLTITSMLSQYYKPTPALQKQIEELTVQYSTYTVGVHIRRTDHKTVINDNPLEAFVAEMTVYIETHKDCKFYVASDDEGVKHDLKARFPGKVLTQDCSLNRNSVEGIQAAVVELFALGKTNLLIGSRGSTFSEFAAMLYDTPLTYISDHTTRTDYK